jgi:hypothetical protein
MQISDPSSHSEIHTSPAKPYARTESRPANTMTNQQTSPALRGIHKQQARHAPLVINKN